MTGAGVALPSVASALHVAPASAIWLLTALGVATALFGRLAYTWGVRRFSRWKRASLALLATATAAVHHRCITRTPFGGC